MINHRRKGLTDPFNVDLQQNHFVYEIHMNRIDKLSRHIQNDVSKTNGKLHMYLI